LVQTNQTNWTICRWFYRNNNSKFSVC